MLIYGMTTGSLQHRLNKTPDEARRIAEQYWHAFPRIQPWLREVITQCRKQKYVRYWSGRIWREEEVKDMYKGANAQIQGGCADLLSIAAMRCQDYLTATDLGHVVSFIHDELLFEVREDKLMETARELAKIMEVEDLFGLPFATDCKSGPSYGQLKKFQLED